MDLSASSESDPPKESFLTLLGKRKFWATFFLLSYTIGFFVTIGINQLEDNLIIFAYPIGILDALRSIMTLPLQLLIQFDPFLRSSPPVSVVYTIIGFVLLAPYLIVLVVPGRLSQKMRIAFLIAIIVMSLLAIRGCAVSSWDVLQW